MPVAMKHAEIHHEDAKEIFHKVLQLHDVSVGSQDDTGPVETKLVRAVQRDSIVTRIPSKKSIDILVSFPLVYSRVCLPSSSRSISLFVLRFSREARRPVRRFRYVLSLLVSGLLRHSMINEIRLGTFNTFRRGLRMRIQHSCNWYKIINACKYLHKINNRVTWI